MKPETKAAVGKWLVEFIAFLIILGLNWWLVEGNGWLIWFLSSAEWSTLILSVKVADNRNLFGIADRELVRVSALANSLEEKVQDLESKLEEVKSDLAEMERKRRTGWS
jgi:hypothetical protein